jgi:hypothetical protein
MSGLRRNLGDGNPLGPVEPEGLEEVEHIDRLVPPKIMRLTQHLHNLIYIRFFYENIGQQPPKWVTGEMQRVEDITIEQLEREKGQGGALWKGKT